MAATNDPTTFGATIVSNPLQAIDIIDPPPTLDSPAITPASSREDLRHTVYSNQRAPSHSPLHKQEPYLTTIEPAVSRQTTRTDASVNEKDVEAGPTSPLNPFTSKVSVDCTKESNMWPSKQTLMQSREAEKKRKRENKLCGPVLEFWARFSKRQKLSIKIAFAFLLVGLVVVIGVCISIAVNGTVYVSDAHSKEIPEVQ